MMHYMSFLMYLYASKVRCKIQPGTTGDGVRRQRRNAATTLAARERGESGYAARRPIGCAKTANNKLPVLAERVHSVTVMIYLSHSTGEFSLLVDLLRTRLGG